MCWAGERFWCSGPFVFQSSAPTDAIWSGAGGSLGPGLDALGFKYQIGHLQLCDQSLSFSALRFSQPQLYHVSNGNKISQLLLIVMIKWANDCKALNTVSSAEQEIRKCDLRGKQVCLFIQESQSNNRWSVAESFLRTMLHKWPQTLVGCFPTFAHFSFMPWCPGMAAAALLQAVGRFRYASCIFSLWGSAWRGCSHLSLVFPWQRQLVQELWQPLLGAGVLVLLHTF